MSWAGFQIIVTILHPAQNGMVEIRCILPNSIVKGEVEDNLVDYNPKSGMFPIEMPS